MDLAGNTRIQTEQPSAREMTRDSTSSSFDEMQHDDDAWSTSIDANTTWRVQSTGHFDLISFLSVVQNCAVDILPLTWREAENPLGRGGTAVVNQALVNLEISFAFKRTVKLRVPQVAAANLDCASMSEKDLVMAEYKSQEVVYRALISELLILRHPSVRHCRNIVDIQAICWEIDEKSHKPWPVLIFPKSDFGDLRRFLKSDRCIHMTNVERLKLCSYMAEGLAVLHANDIIHGDIKPENILMYKDEKGGLVPKLIDFGSSTPPAPDRLVYLPRSAPWTAPERTHRAVPTLSAKKMDVFSFGLLCLWLLVENQYSDDSWLCEMLQSVETHSAISSHSKEAGHVLGSSLPCQRASGLIEDYRMFESDAEENLKAFFKCTLAMEPGKRILDWNLLIQYLGGEADKPRTQPLISKAELGFSTHCTFKVTRDIVELCRAHFRVRKAIFECLQAKAHYDGCEECAHVGAFQLTICYSIGFGVGRSADLAHFWQGKGILSKADLAGEIEDLRMQPRIAIEDQKMWELYDKGHLIGVNLARIYQTSENLESVLNLYNREISDMAAILGCDHLLVQILEGELGLILSEKGDYRAAEALQESLRQKKMTKYGVQSPRTWNTFLDLASTHGRQGKWKEAAQLLETVTDIAYRLNGPKHIDSLAMMAYLASAYRGQGKLQQAEAKCLQIIEDVGPVLGHDHRFIFDVKEILASTYAKQGQWVKAEKMYRETKTGHDRISGPKDSVTLTAQNGLAMTLYEQGKLKEAEELQSEIVTTWEALYGLQHPWSLVAMSDLALILKAQEVYGRAKELLEKAIDISIKISGRENRDTIKFMNNLANVLRSEGKWEGLLETQLEIVEIAKRILDDNDYPTLLLYSMNLAQIYTKLGKYSEAEALAHTILETAEQRLGLEHLTTLKALLCLAGTYRAQCSPPRWSDTEKVEMRLVEVATRTLGPGNPTTLLGMEYLAVTYLEQARHAEAETLVKDILLIKQSHLGASDISTLRSLNLLCRVYCLQGRLDLAEDLAANLSSITMAIFGLEAPFTLTCLSSLASIYRLQGRGEQTSELLLEALGIDVELSE